MGKNFIYFVVISLVVLVGGFYLFADGPQKDKVHVTMYKSPDCGCCGGYAEELRRSGFGVEVIFMDDMQSIKDKYDVPSGMQSCHTSVIENYVVEGHVPIKAVKKLLKESPEIAGIALPRMPAGAPGMPGVKRGEFVVYELNEDYTEFLRV